MKAKGAILPLANRGVNLPSRPKTASFRSDWRRQSAVPLSDDTSLSLPGVTYAMGWDWIEFTAIMGADSLPVSPFLFTHEHTGHGSKYFLDLYKIDTVVHGEVLPFALMEVKPRPSFLDTHLVKIKIDNRFCYSPDIKKTVIEFLREYNLTFKNWTRLDMFCDVQQINAYSENVQQFMQHCASRKLVLKGKGMKVHHKRNEVETITWGSRSSGVAITMYNKTTEMLKKAWKPWIEQLWKQSNFDIEKDVYRLEYSVKKGKTDIVADSGETIGTFSDIDLIDQFDQLISYYHNTHFQLAINKEGERFSRLQRVYPFVFTATIYKPKTSCIRPKSTNYTKAYVKRLAVDALFYQKKGHRIQASYCYDHLLSIVERYSLHKWFERKFAWLNLTKSRYTVFDIAVRDYLKSQRLTQTTLF